MTHDELMQVYEASKPAERAYLKAAADYRAGHIGDTAFIAARLTRDFAAAAYDAAEAQFIAESCGDMPLAQAIAQAASVGYRILAVCDGFSLRRFGSREIHGQFTSLGDALEAVKVATLAASWRAE